MAATDQVNGNGSPGAPILPPQDLQAEQSVLGAVLLSDTTLYRLIVEVGLDAQDFYREDHRLIYEAMLELNGEGQASDALVVADHLKQSGRLERVGGKGAVEALAGAVPALGNVAQYAKIVKDHALLRRLLSASYEIQSQVAGHGAPPRELVDLAERAILEVAQDDRRKDFQAIGDVLDLELDKLERLSQQDSTVTGTPSGFSDLDAITGGFQPGNLIVLAARPSMGKSALMANFAENAAIQAGKPVAVFSLEMSESELASRFIASQAQIAGDNLRKGRVSAAQWKKIHAATKRLGAAPLFIDDSSELSILDVRAKARRLAQQHDDGLGLLVVDYLQLMRTDGRIENRAEQIGQVSRGLKTLARELEVPVIALSQLNRGVEQRTDKKPLLSDLRESGAIEQDADLVLMLYREDYYDHESERAGIADLSLAKHRNGGLGTVELAFLSDFPKFATYQNPDRV